jgi:phosphatidylserine synthase
MVKYLRSEDVGQELDLVFDVVVVVVRPSLAVEHVFGVAD